MLKLTRLVLVLGVAALLQACTAAANMFDNNCSGNGGIDPGSDYCAGYTDGP